MRIIAGNALSHGILRLHTKIGAILLKTQGDLDLTRQP